ncbi:MAG: rhomboid family intramembrane serine protease [Sphingobium sp.]|jgi:membrane associated rhomboid family serine protease|nr:rhomboid family intramembrane serine protease [Sphingobium sp.]MCI1272677.1 rhomboid family intramembrane serine protease [Sphingobium sp.]MCI1756148.1 rhomboid family intramembrane serine protease [Sphingobium sp.]MCI2053530.1 rhomboid family intramembrane serine protease [Sphingobium sp.]
MRPATSTSPFSSAISWIAGLTVLVFVLARFTGAEAALDYAAGFIPARVHHPDLLDHAGLPFGAVPVILTPLTSALLHGGWIHLGFNMLMLLFCGRQVEQVLGPRLILPLYLVGAYAAAAGQWALGPDLAVPMIGASGAISAVIGAYALLFGSREVKAWGPIPASVVRMLWLGAAWTVLQFLIGVASSTGNLGLGTGDASVAVGAHIGGFIAGLLLTRPLLAIRFRRNVVRH